MSDDKKTEIVLDEVPSAPAVHTDALWDGPRLVRNIHEKPVYIETKQQYWEELGKAGMRMPDQAESNTNDHLREVQVPIELTEAPIRPQMRQGEAHLLAAVDAVFKARDLVVTVFTCNACILRNRFSGMQVRMTKQEVSFTCKCGTFGYKPPMGTTDLFMEKLPGLALKSESPTVGTIQLANGSVITVPVQTLTDQEALILKAFAQWLVNRDINFHSFHAGCFMGDPENFDNTIQCQIGHNDVIMVCPCRQLFWRNKRVSDALTH